MEKNSAKEANQTLNRLEKDIIIASDARKLIGSVGSEGNEGNYNYYNEGGLE